jgi:hypothetical protein
VLSTGKKFMQRIFYLLIAIVTLAGCNKKSGTKVEIYMLKSFSISEDLSTRPATLSIVNAVLADTPLVANHDISFYIKSSATFILKKDIKPIIQNYGPDKAFAVTVDNEPVYYGQVHPAYMSSIRFGIATFDPVYLSKNQLKIEFAPTDGSTYWKELDKRNDSRLLGALKVTGRLR